MMMMMILLLILIHSTINITKVNIPENMILRKDTFLVEYKSLDIHVHYIYVLDIARRTRQ